MGPPRSGKHSLLAGLRRVSRGPADKEDHLPTTAPLDFECLPLEASHTSSSVARCWFLSDPAFAPLLAARYEAADLFQTMGIICLNLVHEPWKLCIKLLEWTTFLREFFRVFLEKLSIEEYQRLMTRNQERFQQVRESHAMVGSLELAENLGIPVLLSVTHADQALDIQTQAGALEMIQGYLRHTCLTLGISILYTAAGEDPQLVGKASNLKEVYQFIQDTFKGGPPNLPWVEDLQHLSLPAGLDSPEAILELVNPTPAKNLEVPLDCLWDRPASAMAVADPWRLEVSQVWAQPMPDFLDQVAQALADREASPPSGLTAFEARGQEAPQFFNSLSEATKINKIVERQRKSALDPLIDAGVRPSTPHLEIPAAGSPEKNRMSSSSHPAAKQKPSLTS